jgi:hypothetical protein
LPLRQRQRRPESDFVTPNTAELIVEAMAALYLAEEQGQSGNGLLIDS